MLNGFLMESERVALVAIRDGLTVSGEVIRTQMELAERLGGGVNRQLAKQILMWDEYASTLRGAAITMLDALKPKTTRT